MTKKYKIFVLALLPLGLCLPARNIYAQEGAFFRELSGAVEIKPPGSEAWVNAAAGDRIEKNTLVSTGFRSTAVVVTGSSVIMVRPLTRLSLDEIIRSQDGEMVNLRLHTGRIRAEVNPPLGGKTDFTVKSPIATASVRGTVFEFDTENLRVEEGRVVYSLDNGRQASVAAGGMSHVDEINNTVISPFAAAAELLSPALPPGSASGNSLGDRAPAIIPPAYIMTGIGFGWD
ncbi:MAG: FecR family protein [Treponema sp.]|jgi:hypothetical protein|nr:FecR family protein [Treponema sp.]